MKFDIETFAAVQGQDADLIKSVGTVYGVPNCMTKLAKDALRLIPSTVLNSMNRATKIAQNSANNSIKDITNTIFFNTGVVSFDTETGQFVFVTDISDAQREADGGSLLDDIGSFVGTLNGVLAAGGNLYNNYQAKKQDIENIRECIDGYLQVLKFTGSATTAKDELTPEQRDALLVLKFKQEVDEVVELKSFVDEAQDVINAMDSILVERLNDPTLEPEFNANFSDNLSDNFRTEDDEEDSPLEIFRLVFGPPESVTGRFLLSEDGLYFDSQTSGCDLALQNLKKRKDELKESEKWKFEFDPSIGGKGVAITEKELGKTVGTIFDLDLIDNSDTLKIFYDEDNFLQVLIEERDKAISTFNQQIAEFVKTGAGVAIIDNTKKVLLSETAFHNIKINKRKKQIEIAVKAPSMFGGTSFFSPGNIPINDFSYLQNLNIALELNKQRGLVLDQDDVSSIILPLCPEFAVSFDNQEFTTFDNLLVPAVGKGEVTFDTSNVSGIEGVPIRITDSVVTDGLFSMYNFLDSAIVDPSSTNFTLNDSASETKVSDAQLVAKSASSVFTLGLGAPLLNGVAKFQSSTLVSTQPSGVGSYIRLPDTADFRDLMYKKQGFSIDFWTYIPTLMDPENGWSDKGVSSSHRLIMSCENVGIAANVSAQSNILRISPDYSDNVTRGFVMGFTRDNRMVSNTDPTNSFLTNTVSDVSFFLAPTQSFDGSSIAFVNTLLASGCPTTEGWASWNMNVSTLGPNSAKFQRAAEEFINVCLTVEPEKNEVKIYLDGNLMGTSGIDVVFGVPAFTSPKLPSFKKGNSFEYDGANVGTSAGVDLSAGPKMNDFFTPWLLGGGWTDGMALSGNFMGGAFGGVRSALNGHVGGFKFYNKPITPGSVLTNFNAQKKFFKNIRTHKNLSAKIFLLLGQSNAEGYSLGDAGTPISSIPDVSAGYKTKEFDNVYIWNALGLTGTPNDWSNLKMGFNNMSQQIEGAHLAFGPEASLASALSLQFPEDDIFLGKWAKISTFLATSAGSIFGPLPALADWNVSSLAPLLTDHLYDRIFSLSSVGFWTADGYGLGVSSDSSGWLSDRGRSVEVCGIFWIQGEADSLFEETADLYEENLTNFVSGLRTSLSGIGGTSSIPFIIGKTYFPLEGGANFEETVRAAQQSFADATDFVEIVETSGLGIAPDNTHFTGAGMLNLGNSLARKYIDTL